MAQLTYEKSLRVLGLFSLKIKLKKDITDVHKCLVGVTEEGRARLFSVIPSERTN